MNIIEACKTSNEDEVLQLLAQGHSPNEVRGYDLETPLYLACLNGHLAISQLLISSNKFTGYTHEYLKGIIDSCRDRTLSFSIIAYRCYKQLQLIDPGYTPNDRERTVIERGRVHQE